MGASKKNMTNYRNLLTGGMRKDGIILWRYVLNAAEKDTGSEKSFYIELEMVNPLLSPDETFLGFKSRTTINPEDLQYALAGTASATELQTESLVKPSFVTVRFGSLGQKAKHFSLYESFHNTKIEQHPFLVQAGNCIFTDNHLSGFISYTESEISQHPEYMCSEGYAEWNLDFDFIQEFEKGFHEKTEFWAPVGSRTNFSGTINFCGTDYTVNPLTSYGYVDKFSGKSLPNPWFHISASSLSSIISGRTLFDSSFTVQGCYNDKVSLLMNIEENRLSFCADEGKRSYECIWDCQQMPQNDEDQLHWSISISNKTWVVDIDIFCKVIDLYNKVIELPAGNRNTMSLVTSCSGTGEIKLFKRIKNNLEQIEYLRIAKAFCEFGRIEEGEN